MRTTLTLDDDLAGVLKRKAAELGIPFKEMVNRTLRSGLGVEARPTRGAPVQTIPHRFGFKPGIDLDRLNQLVDDLEAETLATSHNLSPPDDSPRHQPTHPRPQP